MPMFNDDVDTETTDETPIEPVEDVVVEEPVEEELNIPSIELVIEDGTGVPNANSYCDLDYAMKYCAMKGYNDWLSLTDDEQKVFIIRGTEFVNSFYTWKGTRKFLTQSTAFPRNDLYDIDHFRVDGIPEVLKKACLEAAWLNATAGADTLFSSKDVNGKIKRQKVDSLEVEYFNSDQDTSTSSSQIDYKSIYDILNKLLKGLYKTGSNESKVCTRVVQTGW